MSGRDKLACVRVVKASTHARARSAHADAADVTGANKRQTGRRWPRDLGGLRLFSRCLLSVSLLDTVLIINDIPVSP